MTIREPEPHRWWLRAVWLIAGLAGLVFGFGFGLQISGVWMGVMLAITSAIFCTVMADGLAQLVLRAGRRDNSRPDDSR